MKMKFAVLSIALCIGLSLYGGIEKIEFRRIGVEQGLSQSSVNCILQDALGFIWIGTADGLNRFDGRNFKILQHDPQVPTSLSQNSITAIYEDKEGYLWVGTKMGLNKFNPRMETFTSFTHKPYDIESLSNNDVRTLYGYEADDGSTVLWVGTKSGLDRFDPATGKFKRYDFDEKSPGDNSGDFVNVIHGDHLGRIWSGALLAKGMTLFDPRDESSTRFFHDDNNPDSLSADDINSLLPENPGVVWVGTLNGGLDRYDSKTGKFTHFRHDPNDPSSLAGDTVNAIYRDTKGVLWIGTDRGLCRFDEVGKFFRYLHDPLDPTSLSDNDIQAIMEDECGALWFGVRDGGVNIYDRKLNKFTTFRYSPRGNRGLSDSKIWALAEAEDGKVWIGTEKGGISLLDPSNDTFTYLKNDPDDPGSLVDNKVYSICRGRDGSMWVGTTNGLERYDPERRLFIHKKNLPRGVIVSLCEDRYGNLWIGSASWGGISRLDPTGDITHYFPGSSRDGTQIGIAVRVIYEDSLGQLWVGTKYSGLYKLDPGTGTFVHNFRKDPNHPGSLNYNSVNTVLEGRDGVLWVGTNGGGLNKFDNRKNGFVTYTQKNGLPNNMVLGILEDNKGNLWLSTTKGLARFNPKTETFRTYTVKDGLQSYEFSVGAYLKSGTGELYFGGTDGLNRFYPEEIVDNLHLPNVVITGFKINNESVKIDSDGPLSRAIQYTDRIVLSHSDKIFSFEFAALDYTDPQKNQYKHKMEGFQPEWTNLGFKNDTTFTNLNPGRYTFQVIGSNNDGRWNLEGAAVEIIITPPYWQSWWFKASMGLAVVLFVLFLLRIRAAKIKERQERKRLEEERKREKDKIKAISQQAQMGEMLSMIAHQYRQPLSTISTIAGNLSIRLKLDRVEKDYFLDELSLINGQSQFLSRTIDDFRNFYNPKKKRELISLREVVERSLIIIGKSLESKGIEVELEGDVENKVQIFVNDCMQIIINILLNSYDIFEMRKVENPKISIRLYEQGRFQVMQISDNGGGIEKQNLNKIFLPYFSTKESGTGLGLYMSKTIVEEKMGGDLKVENVDNGVQFTVKIPLYTSLLDNEKVTSFNEKKRIGRSGE